MKMDTALSGGHITLSTAYIRKLMTVLGKSLNSSESIMETAYQVH